MWNKANVLRIVRERVAAELDRATRRAADAAEGATHEENKPEGDKDMRSTEASYIARGQAGRVVDLERARALLAGVVPRAFASGARIEATAVVELEAEDERVTTYMLLPAAGGQKIEQDGATLGILATTSPLGRALLGARLGDDLEIATPTGPRKYAVVGLA